MPNLPHFNSSGDPHRSHFSSVTLLHPLDVFHVLAGILELFLKVAVEAVQQVGPLLLAFFNVVQLLFQLGRVRDIEDVREILHQQIADHHADLSRIKPPADPHA